MRIFRAALIGALLIGASQPAAFAQGDPVADRYRAYQAALARGDLDTAEAAAALALEQSEERDGDGGRTGVLAANLAQVRIDLGQLEEARAPARRARALAGYGEGQVPPAYADLLVAMANLNDAASMRDMRAALTAAEATGQLSAHTYNAALRFGDWALRTERASEAEFAYDTAVRLAAGDSDAIATARAEALVGQGIARAMRNREMSGRNRTGTRLAIRPDRDADESLIAAIRLVRPIAEREANARVTRAQVVFGAALSWAHARRMTLNALGWLDPYTPDDLRSVVVDLDPGDGVPACGAGVTTDPPPDFPSEEIARHGASAIALRFVVDAAGNVTGRHVIGTSGSTELARATQTIMPQWQVQTASGCSAARIIFKPVVIVIDDVMNSERISGGRGSTRTWVARQDRGVIAVTPD